MTYMLRGLKGPYQNRYFRLKAGMSLGRKQGDILLDEDPTVSSLHGHIVARRGGLLALQDAGSQNQFLIDGQKVDKLELIPGIVFQVGQSAFEVLYISEEEARRLAPVRSWRELIIETLEKNDNLESSEAHVFSPPITVECISGPNAEDTWFLGFGPRLFGPLCEDIEILEKDSADIAFEIYQTSMGLRIKSRTSQLALNKRFISQDMETNLSNGDEIQVGASIFKVQYT